MGKIRSEQDIRFLGAVEAYYSYNGDKELGYFLCCLELVHNKKGNLCEKFPYLGGGGGVPPRQQNPNLNLRILKPRGGGVNLKKIRL